MKCSNCGTEFGEGMFCPECGTKCEGTLQGYGRELKEDEGRKQDEGDGEKADQEREKSEQDKPAPMEMPLPEKKSKRKSKKILVGIVIVLAIMIKVLLGGSSNEETMIEESAAEESGTMDIDTTANMSKSISNLSAKETVEAYIKAYTMADYDIAIQFCAKECNYYEKLNFLRSSEIYEYIALDFVDGDEEYANKLAANKHFKEHIDFIFRYMFNGRYLIKDEVFEEDDTAEYKVVVEMADNTDECIRSYLSVFFEEYYYDNPNEVEEFISGDLSTLWIDFFEMCGEELNAGYKDFLDANLTYSEYEYDIVLKKVNDEWIISSMTGIDGMDETIVPDIFDIDVNNAEDADTYAQEYIFPDSDSRYLSEEEVRSVEADKLRIARNEIFARHGYIFNDEELSQYFNSTSWYEGMLLADQFDMDALLNDFEKKNIELIERVENEVNGTSEGEGSFIGKKGTYLTTYYVDGFTPKIDILEIGKDTLTFTLGVLGHPSNMLEETAQIINRNTAQLDCYGFIITFTWTDAGSVYVTHQGELTGMDSGIIMPATDGQEYTWAEEFN